MGHSCQEGLNYPLRPPKLKAAQKSVAELERTKALRKDGFPRVTSGRSVLNTPDALFPETHKKSVLTTSRLGASDAVSTLRSFKSCSQGTKVEIGFFSDSLKESAIVRGPPTFKIINTTRSPSPDFSIDNIDDLICAAPDFCLDADSFGAAVGSTAGDIEEVSPPPEIPQISRKHLRDLAPGLDPMAKQTKNTSNQQGSVEQHRFKPARPDSVQVGSPSTSTVPGTS